MLLKAVKAFLKNSPSLSKLCTHTAASTGIYKNVVWCGVSEIASKFASLQTASCAVRWVRQRCSPDVVTRRNGAWENKRRRQMRTEEKHGFGNKFHSKAWIYANLRCILGNRNRPIPRGSEEEECIITLFPWENIPGWKKSFEVGFCWAPLPSLPPPYNQ